MASKISKILYLFVVATGLGLASCVADAPPRIELAAETVVPDKMGLVFWVDGLDIEAFESLRKAGKLPNITKYLIDRGVTVEGAVASFPTITYANDTSFATGMFPGHHGIVGNKWFDRNSLIFQDYNFIKTYQKVDSDFNATTIYEALGDEFTATILTPVRRGATRNIDNWMSAGISWHFGLQKNVNHLTTARFELIAGVANQTGRWPKYIFAYFVTPDTAGHDYGTKAPPYTEMILDIDRQIGHICQSLEKAGLLEKTFITLISDHGFVDTPKHLDVADYFHKTLKIPTISKRFGRGELFEKRIAHFAKARAVVATGGMRRCSIHLRPGKHWWARPTEKEIDGFRHAQFPVHTAGPYRRPSLPGVLASQPATDLVMVRLGDNSIRVQNKAGIGVIDRIVQNGEKLYRYRVTKGTDPLGYSSNPKAALLMDGEYHDADAWLAATLETPKPDCVVQLIELNDSPRSGDIVLFAADGWALGGTEKGGHGGLLRHEIIVPWIWAGPSLPAKSSITAARTVDLMPTMLHLI
ncbi:MAG: alkaline phosphatase family protein, partial [Planctomycetota bacterium]|nr:alkaline phosphatase family protein [Planctomycetota bacterium]